MKLNQYLAIQLLKITFSIYLVVSSSITAMHMYTEWFQFEKYLKKDLYELGDSAKKGIMLAMWDLDYKQVEFIANGLLELPIVVGIEIHDKKIDYVYGVPADIVKRYDLTYGEDGLAFHVGTMTIYSSRHIVFDRIKHVYILTIVNALVKAIALWFIIFWVSKRLISKPLTAMTAYCRRINQGQLTDSDGAPLQLNVSVKQHNEIKILETAFNSMLLKLLKTQDNLRNLNQDLEHKVTERTKELSQKNQELQDALEEVKTLRGILPICSFCKKIRNDQGAYEQIENYIHKHSGVDFSHTVCPECMKEHYSDYIT